MPFPIAYIAGQFPLRSETFVWREVRALRAAGLDGAHVRAARAGRGDAGGLARRFARNDGGRLRGVGGGSRAIAHPVASARGAIDAMFKCEAAKPPERVKLVAQAAAGAALARKRFEGARRAARARALRARAGERRDVRGAVRERAFRSALPATPTICSSGVRRSKLKLKRAAFVGCISEWHRERCIKSIVPRPDCGLSDRPLRRRHCRPRAHAAPDASEFASVADRLSARREERRRHADPRGRRC